MGKGYLDQYPMCQDQPAQIDCRVEACVYYRGSGQCSNVSPAITLNPSKTYVCWSETTLEDLDVARLDEERSELAPEVERYKRPVYKHGFFYRRRGPGNWEAKIAGYSWRPVVDPFAVRKLEYDYQNAMPEQDEELSARLGISAAMTWEAMDMSEVAKRMKVQLSNLVAEAKSQAAEDDRALMKSRLEANTFAWEADPDDEDAKIQEAMEYLAWLGRRLHPYWSWDTWEGRLDYQLWTYDRRGMKVRQWRGWGLSRESCALDNMEKHGVILVLDGRSLLELWDSTPERKYQVGRGIVQQTIENTYVVEEGECYPQFIPTITEDPEEDAQTDASTA